MSHGTNQAVTSPGTVSMNPQSSPNACRKRKMLFDMLPSSTNVSDQSIPMSSSFSSRCPQFRTSGSKVFESTTAVAQSGCTGSRCGCYAGGSGVGGLVLPDLCTEFGLV